MSDCKCEHNDHSHFWLWMFILALCFNSSCVDCSGERTRLQNQVNSLQYQVDQLKRNK